jgi:hypothetical protein
MKAALATAMLLVVSSAAMADNHIFNALDHNNRSPAEFGPVGKDDGRTATNVPGSGAGLGSDAGKRGNVGTAGAAKNGAVAPCASTTELEDALGASCGAPR